MVNFKLDLKVILSIVLVSFILAFIVSLKTLGFNNVFFELGVGSSIVGVLIYLVLSYLNKPNIEILRFGLIGFLTPIIYNLLVLPMLGVPFDVALKVYPLALIDSVIFAIGLIGLIVLIRNLKLKF